MTPTRKQLELAAKAAGYQLEEIKGVLNRWVDSETGMGGCWLPWNPVTDKSDSFDLMVACEIELRYGLRDVWAIADDERSESEVQFYLGYNDKGLATCAAVFLCAVAIGKTMADGRAI